MADLELNALNLIGDLAFEFRRAVGLLQEKHTRGGQKSIFGVEGHHEHQRNPPNAPQPRLPTERPIVTKSYQDRPSR